MESERSQHGLEDNVERNEEDDPLCKEEKEHFFRILYAFKLYKIYASNVVYRRQRYIDGLPDKQKRYLAKYRKRLDAMLRCIDENDQLVQQIIDNVECLFENKPPYSLDSVSSDCRKDFINPDDFEKVQVTFKQFYRDWSEEGADERNICYKPIIQEIVNRFPADSCDTEKIQVLVPGAGLGRLAFEIASRGYCCQGNEFSFYMLFASNFVLNRCKGRNSCSVYPWIHQVDNVLKEEHQLKRIKFPDISLTNLAVLQEKSIFSMCAGDFLEVYKIENEWDCVATCFFIDCANNICTFIEQIHHILKPGGVWLNFGPLQYHYSNSTTEDSIEPSYDNLREIIKSIGFEMQKEELGIKSSYSQNVNSMLKYTYESVFFVCVKKMPKDSQASTNHSHSAS